MPVAALLADVVTQGVVRGDQQPRQYRAAHHPDIGPPAPCFQEDHGRDVLRDVGQAQHLLGVPPDPVMVAVKEHTEGVAVTVDDLAPQRLARDTQCFAHTS